MKKKPISAWLITRGAGLHDALTKGQIVDILSARNSLEDVRRYVQRLHDLFCLTLGERAEGARYNRKGEPIYKAEVIFRILPNEGKVGAVALHDLSRSPLIHCGHDPVFAAQLVKNLEVNQDNETGQEQVIWQSFDKRHTNSQAVARTASRAICITMNTSPASNVASTTLGRLSAK